MCHFVCLKIQLFLFFLVHVTDCLPLFRMRSSGSIIASMVLIIMILLSIMFWPDQAFWFKPNEIRAVSQMQCFIYQIIVFRIAVLYEGTLHGFLVRIIGDVHFLHSARIQSGVIHTGGNRRWCRIEILYLLRHIAKIPDIFCQFHSFFQSGSGMRRHQIWNKILFLSDPLIDFFIFFPKLVIYCYRWFSHQR